ncbi:hypothetical protein LPB140_00485 [Sphingorhabdus lutea]|uniref:Rieske domain-containing protein n=1 Tax=Sphingorhabdus lutea TaxID=1913578 RepID=A0A1L3JE45_9SPHN|nr:nitrite reductase small subunit NirD [Sphingorhabdus lutea]APG63421.1 hypothetical protein LPB140_00485 [Sphingorhabdus lutea]
MIDTENWIEIGTLSDIPRQGARTIARKSGNDIGVFRTLDDRIFALENTCPHKQGPLSQGIVHGHVVTCPLHNWRISLETGLVLGEDKGCTPTIKTKIVEDKIFILLNGDTEPSE